MRADAGIASRDSARAATSATKVNRRILVLSVGPPPSGRCQREPIPCSFADVIQSRGVRRGYPERVLPLGFLALATGTLMLSALQLDWLAPADSATVAIFLIAFVAPLQLLA